MKVRFEQVTVAEAAGMEVASRRPRGSMWDPVLEAAGRLAIGEALWIEAGPGQEPGRARDALLAYLRRRGKDGLFELGVVRRGPGGPAGVRLMLHETVHGPDEPEPVEPAASAGRGRRPAQADK